MYDFGTMQQGSAFTVEPGRNITVSIYFFMDEQYGNRNAHVSLNASNVPEGWSVGFDPPIHTTTINVSGVLTNVSENLYVEPKPVLPQVPEVPEAGVYYLRSPSGLGFLQAKMVNVTIRVPQNASVGQVYDVRIAGMADYYGQAGTVALAQARDLDYKITVAMSGYTETIITPTPQVSPTPAPSPSPTTTPSASATPLQGTQGGDNTLFLLGAIVAIVVIAAVAYYLGRSKKGQP